MAALKQQLTQKLMQKLSPQQIQLMKLLQIPTATLEQRIKEELEANPALDEVDYNEKQDNELDEKNNDEEEFELDDYLKEYIEDDPMSYKYQNKSSGNKDMEEKNHYAVPLENSFHEKLERQLGLLNIKDKRKKIIAEHIIGSIDEDGYLRRDTRAIMDDLIFAQNMYVSEEEVEEIVGEIQSLDPPGLGARDLRESLIIQMERKLDFSAEDSIQDRKYKNIALEILRDYFDEFSKKHYNKLMKQLSLSREELREILDEILKLNPKPTSGTSSQAGNRNQQYIIPDFILVSNDGELDIRLNSRNAPQLTVNTQYTRMLKTFKDHKSSKSSTVSKKDKDAVKFIKNKIDSAKWFIDAIKQRQRTMYKAMYAILQYQKDYFKTGDKSSLRPMILQDIAEMTGLDLSTISRVANSKYIQTEYGTMCLKEFFSESIKKTDGEEVSNIEVKNALETIVENENKEKPLSDEKLRKALKEKGYGIARRTVAKYRELLNIPVARLRKQL